MLALKHWLEYMQIMGSGNGYHNGGSSESTGWDRVPMDNDNCMQHNGRFSKQVTGGQPIKRQNLAEPAHCIIHYLMVIQGKLRQTVQVSESGYANNERHGIAWDLLTLGNVNGQRKSLTPSQSWYCQIFCG